MVNLRRLSRTKIVCTIGPASHKNNTLKTLLRAGMNCARLNLAHGDIDEHLALAKRIRSLSDAMSLSTAILADLPGPKIRLGRLEKEPLYLKGGAVIELTEGREGYMPVEYDGFTDLVKKGDVIYVNDGLSQLRVLGKDNGRIQCRVLVGGEILSHKGINLPNKNFRYDRKMDIDLCEQIAEHVDIIGVSFVADEKDIEIIREKSKNAKVIAKIERREGVKNIKKILKSADGIMVARGDLGVEVGLEEIPMVQKRLIKMANLESKPVITATQMLLSMVDNKRPTRAEVTDVANAILDGTDAVMLSEETAIGKYPAESVRMMKKIATNTERNRDNVFMNKWNREKNVEEVISYDAFEASEALGIKYIVTPTRTGSTPRRVSRFKPKAWILAFTSDEKVKNFLSLSYGVYPFAGSEDEDEIVGRLRDLIKEKRVVLTRGPVTGRVGGTNTLRILEL